MKINSLLILLAVTLTLLLAPARAGEAVPADLPPEMQALLADLLKTVAAAQAAAEPAAHERKPEWVAAEMKPDLEGRPPLGSGSSLRTSGLQTGALSGGRLAPSSSLAGRGAERRNDSAWRQIFPAR